MAKKPKALPHIAEDEKEIIDRIVIACSGKIYHFLKTHSDPKKYANKLLKLWSSEKILFLPNLLFAIMNMSSDEMIFPHDLKMKVAKGIVHDERDVTRAILDLKKRELAYLKSWAATEAFQDLVNEGLLSNISGKRNIKNAPRKLKHGRGYNDNEREGLYSAYMITNDLGPLNKVISKHEALKIIHQKLIKYGRLEEFFLFNGLASVYAIIKSDDKLYKFFNVVAQAFLDNTPKVQASLSRAGLDSKEIQYSLWGPIKNYLGSVKEEDLEGLVREMIRPLVENPIDYRYTLLAISRS